MQTATHKCYKIKYKFYLILQVSWWHQPYTGRQQDRLDSQFEAKQAAVKRKETSSDPNETPFV